VKRIRNAAAHNNCVINNFLGENSKPNTNHGLLQSLAQNPQITPQARKTQLRKAKMRQLISLLYAHKIIVTSQGVHDHISERLNDLSNRIFKNYTYHDCDSLRKSLEFIRHVIDFWFKIG
ncbi:MAG TPA: hypothetical protein VN611_18015, partial [Patescibacteria group bacterium]|nr:hypothetical protein [Patescibacteria group bacterium]